MPNRAGEFVSNLSNEMAYKSFRPSSLPPSIIMDDELIEYLVTASAQIAAIDSIAKRIPNVNLFVSMYIRKEALLSSQIEGTQCTLDDILNPLVLDNANRDVSDVVNYIKATEYALNRLNELPLCARLMKETHGILMQNVRGQEKNPGEFRTSQNWIGGEGSTIKNARYIPPNVEDMNNAISDLEKFINSDTDINPLICAALIHYQFETIHPFLDGNGRIGRLLITLYLIEKKVLTTPALYISYFLKRNRIEYYDRMTEVRRQGNYEQWIKFFLQALTEAAADAIETIDKLTELHNQSKAAVDTLGKSSKTACILLEYIEKNPIIEIVKTSNALGLAYNTVSKSVKLLEENGILIQSDKIGKTRIYSYEKYLQILRKDT